MPLSVSRIFAILCAALGADPQTPEVAYEVGRSEAEYNPDVVLESRCISGRGAFLIEGRMAEFAGFYGG